MKIMSIVGARPNFMKIAPIANAIEKHNELKIHPPIEHLIIHTGQHYDERMSALFFDELEIPRPHVNLEVGSSSHAVQTAKIMEKFESVLLQEKPDVLLVVGDVNSTIACTLVASKVIYNGESDKKRPTIVHVEAGLRSFDRDMPEEINRVLTDALSDLLFVTEEDAIANLKSEGIFSEKIHFIGNVMIDTLLRQKEKALKLKTHETILNGNYQKHWAGKNNDYFFSHNLYQLTYGVVTLHRPSNVDTFDALHPLVQCIKEIASRIPIIFSLHPRTGNSLKKFELYESLNESHGVIFTKPLGYLDFMNLLIHSSLIMTDSGGIQEETTFLGVPCITLRKNTERPVTVKMGTNYLVGTDPDKIIQTANNIMDGKGKEGKIPPKWDGKAGARIIEILAQTF